MTTEAAITCPTCEEAQAPEEFYASSTECRSCKKERSQQNRATAALKVAIADRLIAALEQLAAQGQQPEALIAEPKGRGPAGDATTPGPSIGPREVLS